LKLNGGERKKKKEEKRIKKKKKKIQTGEKRENEKMKFSL